MKKIYNIIIFILTTVLVTSCTHTNGDIGHYFGIWKLEKMTINGAVDVEYGNNILWKFQSGVVCMERVNDKTHENVVGWGTWEEIDDVLRLNFTHYDDYSSQGTQYYSPLPETHIPNGITDLLILQLSGSKMNLQYTTDSGDVILYYFKKW